MPLNLYRRHTPACPHRQKGQNYTKCRCPIWCDGLLNGKRIRRSLALRDWNRAVKRVEKWEESATRHGQAQPETTIERAIESYLADCRARNLKASTITSYEKTLDHLKTFAVGRECRSMDSLDLALLTDFRASREVAPSTSGKELESLRSFCNFALKREWLTRNPAHDLDAPKESGPPTLPFTRVEVDAILEACDRLSDSNPARIDRTRSRARALKLLLLYSGMRLSDGVKLARETVDLDTGRLLLRTMKTGTPLYTKLGPPAINALQAIPDDGSGYFFWNGRSKLSTAVGNARRTLSRVFTAAGITGHPHRFRDTFSVELLEQGRDIRTVQLLLGHTSLKTTEKHYAPFVDSFQRMLDTATAGLDFGTKSGTRAKKPRKLLKMLA